MKFADIDYRKMKTFFTIFLIALSLTANAQTKSIKKSSPLKEASPEIAGMSAERLLRIEANGEITIRHLLTHTSGIGYGMIDGDERIKLIYQKAGITDLFTTKNITIEESVKKLAKLPLHHNPGEKFTYSKGLRDVSANVSQWW